MNFETQRKRDYGEADVAGSHVDKFSAGCKDFELLVFARVEKQAVAGVADEVFGSLRKGGQAMQCQEAGC